MQTKSSVVLAVLLVLAFVITSCVAPVTPQVVEKTVVVEKEKTVVIEKEKTVVVEKEKTVQVVVTATPEPTSAPKAGGTLIVARAADAKGLDPHKQTAFSSFRLLELIYEPLLALDQDLKVVPNLAESWAWSDEGKTLTVKLRPNVKFHNGDVLTAEDVKFTFERILDENTAAAARSSFTGIDAIEAPDATTVVFKLKGANVALLAAMTNPNSGIVSKKVVSAEDPAKVTIGTGPFKLVKWDVDRTTTLAANKDYWLEEGKITLDPEQRKAIYNTVQQKLAEAAPWVWLYVGYEYRIMQPYVKGFTPMPNGSLVYLRDVWLDK